MKKLEDIPKNEIFKIPDGYFDTLPSKIQSRISNTDYQRKLSLFFQYKFQYAIPLVVILIVGYAWYQSSTQKSDTDAFLASVDTEQLITYLDNSELSTEEILETMDSSDLESIEEEVYALDLQIEDLDAFEELNIENL